MIMKKEKDFNKIKLKEREKGITLIALVITIIVLLILASVSIAMLTGENGILKKASTAKEKTLEAEYEEKIKLAILGARDNNGNFSKELLNDELKKYGLSGKTDENGTTTVEKNGKTYTIDNKGTLTSKDSTENDNNKGITAQMVAEHPETYYGLKVTNYTSTNGQNDWRIFYSDGEHIFLITGDYVDLSVANRLSSNTGMTKIGDKYRVYWETEPSSLQTVDDTVKTRFKATGYTLNSSNANSKCVSRLLNTSNWESYKDNNGMAEYAVGGSTIEMWMDSWNKLCDKKYNKPSDKLYCNNTNSTGYYVGTSSSPSDCFIEPSVMSVKEGYKNSTLYYPRKSGVSDGADNCNSYWLASTSAGDSNYVLGVSDGGGMGLNRYRITDMGLRPVVSLNSEIKVNATDAE